MKKPELEVFYDGACVICSKEIEHYWKQKGAESIRWVNIASAEFDPKKENLNLDDLMFRMHARRGSELFTGIDTFIEIWRELPKYRFLTKVFGNRLIRSIADFGYELFIRIRPYLPKKDCSSSACEIRIPPKGKNHR